MENLRKTTQTRLELVTSAVTGRRSNQLSHWALITAILGIISRHLLSALRLRGKSRTLRAIPLSLIVDLQGLEPGTDRL